MPKAYESMRDKFQSQGMSREAAEGKAARIYNANAKPGHVIVTRQGEGKKKRRGRDSVKSAVKSASARLKYA